MKLDEDERGNRTRLMKVKDMLEKKDAAISQLILLFFFYLYYQIRIMLSGHDTPGLPGLDAVKDNGEVIVFGVKLACGYMKFQPFMIYQQLFLFICTPTSPLSLASPVYNPDALLRINDDTVHRC